MEEEEESDEESVEAPVVKPKATQK